MSNRLSTISPNPTNSLELKSKDVQVKIKQINNSLAALSVALSISHNTLEVPLLIKTEQARQIKTCPLGTAPF